VSTPPWLAATAGYNPLPGQVNQLLGAHTSAWIYSGGVLQVSERVGSGVYQSTESQYLSQTFVTGASQTTIGQVNLQVSTVGGSPVTATIGPLTLALYASSAGLPTGSPLSSVTLAEQSVYTGAFWLPMPLSATVSPAAVYQLVLSPAGTSSAYYVWQQSNQTSGASTSPSSSGTVWTGAAYGLMYEVYDQSGTLGAPQYLVDDDGARTTAFTYNAAGQLATITEQVLTQSGATQYSQRTLTYTDGLLTGVA
jgi:YD repeat-containing protein